MLNYLERNVNPKGRKTGDCSTRALVSVTGLPYEECLKMQVNETLRSFYDVTSKQTICAVLEKLGWTKMKQPRKQDGSKYKVGELDQIIPLDVRKRGVLVTVANHHTAIVGNDLIDIWNCSRKSVGNYYIRNNIRP